MPSTYLDLPAVTSSLVDSAASVATFLDSLVNLPTDPPSLYLDLEGEKLSRHGSISLIEILVHPQSRVYLIDVYSLQGAAFTTAGRDGKTLKDILESATVPKVFFDVRNDSDALFAHFGIALQGVQDVQLMENASRYGPASRKRLLSGLAKCIELDAPISYQEKQVWAATKKAGLELFDPVHGGSYQVFNARPLTDAITRYCIQDVTFLPQLRSRYWDRLDLAWKNKVGTETRARVLSSQSPTYQPHGAHKALGPWPAPPLSRLTWTTPSGDNIEDHDFYDVY